MRGAAPAIEWNRRRRLTSIPDAAQLGQRGAKKTPDRMVCGGLDTHKELHVAAVIDAAGAVLGTRSFSTTRAGYRALLAWIGQYGHLARIGVEGTGSYGAGLTRHLAKAGVMVLEVDRPDRSDRRRRGKDDDLDAISAAGAALHSHRTVIPESKDGAVEALRVLRTARAQAVRERSNAVQLLRMTIVAAPDEVRDQVRSLTRMQLIRVVAAWRPDVSNVADPVTAYRVGLKSMARRYLELSNEITGLDELITPLVEALAPRSEETWSAQVFGRRIPV
jgi:transposase